MLICNILESTLNIIFFFTLSSFTVPAMVWLHVPKGKPPAEESVSARTESKNKFHLKVDILIPRLRLFFIYLYF